MAEGTTVQIAENSPEEIAYKLLRNVAGAEGFQLRTGPSDDKTKPTREWILDTYAECLLAVRQPVERRATAGLAGKGAPRPESDR